MTRDEAFVLWRENIENYKQGRHVLQQEDSFCCLGVLCDLLKDELNLEVRTERTTYFNGDSAYLPDVVCRFMQMDSGGALENGESLTDYNDNGFTFSEIKEYLYPEKLLFVDYSDDY